MKNLCIPMSVLLISLLGHDAKANNDDAGDIIIHPKTFTQKLQRDIERYNFEINIFSEKGYALPPEILERVGDQDVVGRLRLLKTQDGKRQFNSKFSEEIGTKPDIWYSKKIYNLLKSLKMKFLFDLARERSYQAQKECFKLVLRSQEHTTD